MYKLTRWNMILADDKNQSRITKNMEPNTMTAMLNIIAEPWRTQIEGSVIGGSLHATFSPCCCMIFCFLLVSRCEASWAHFLLACSNSFSNSSTWYLTNKYIICYCFSNFKTWSWFTEFLSQDQRVMRCRLYLPFVSIQSPSLRILHTCRR